MMDLAVNFALWAIVLALALMILRQSRPLLKPSARQGAEEFLRLLPRIMIGVMGSGYIAAALPHDLVGQWLGESSGLLGVLIATAAGALTPGGPVIGFALGAAALKGGAGAPQVIAYSTAWALFAFPRVFTFELPMLPSHVVWLRVVASLPIPFLAAAAAMLIGKP
jgi:uncharacterized membrane protein YraQ (UPF0718 family)